jgi:ADP-ribose pyrophosphatase YjhB (NUDIX family)
VPEEKHGMDKFGFFGPSERHFVPSGGFCISAFAISRKDEDVLVLRPAKHEKWEKWAPNWKIYSPEALEREYKSWRFPSSYVKFGEHPDDTLRRIMEEQLGISRYQVKSYRLVNYYSPSRRYQGEMHWDYCFMYNVSFNGSPTLKPWIQDISYVQIKELREEDFGSAQGSLIDVINTF